MEDVAPRRMVLILMGKDRKREKRGDTLSRKLCGGTQLNSS